MSQNENAALNSSENFETRSVNNQQPNIDRGAPTKPTKK